ncbi:MAG TPA: aminoglycoside phosphotransferase family protein [Jiangellaceae bacterium]|nr:aminoglycoside phosphotransferase family protein [Jiangellaceae bacterium]
MATPQMHDEEYRLDVEVVSRLVARQFPQWADLPVRSVSSSGTINALFRLGDDLLARLPRVAQGAEGVYHEHRWLPRLASALPVKVPVLLGEGSPDAELGYPSPWSVLEWLDGDNPEPGCVEDPDALAQDLAAFVAAMRAIDVLGAPPAYRGGPLHERDEFVRTSLVMLHDDIDTAAALRLWEQSLQTPVWTGRPVWVHSDLMPGNLLTEDGRLTGVIDFAASGIGDPACDLMPAWSLLTSSARSAFMEALGVDEATWLRGLGWALCQAAGALPYYRITNPVMAHTARLVLDEILADS